MPDTIILSHAGARATAHRAIDAAPDGYVVTIGKPNRTAAQNAKLHPMIQDLIDQVPDVAEYDIPDVKLMFMDELRSEMRFLPKLSGQGVFPVGQRTSTLTKEQFAGLVELVYAYGARAGVVWSEPNPYEGMMR